MREDKIEAKKGDAEALKQVEPQAKEDAELLDAELGAVSGGKIKMPGMNKSTDVTLKRGSVGS